MLMGSFCQCVSVARLPVVMADSGLFILFYNICIFCLTDLCKGIGLKLCARSCQCSECVLRTLSFRDQLSTCPNFSAALQTVLVLKKYARTSLKKSGVEIFNHLKKFQYLMIHDSLMLKRFLARGESWTTSPVFDALAGMIKRTPAQL